MDFVARDPTGGCELIQVCADTSEPDTLSRELHGLETAAAEYPRAVRRLLLLDGDARPRAPGVAVQTAYEWILEGTAG